MDMNLVVLGGRLASEPEIRQFDSGATLARYLVIVRTEDPRRRTDVVPVTRWDPNERDLGRERGDQVWVTGTVQRRFWSTADGRRSRIEIVASDISDRAHDDASD